MARPAATLVSRRLAPPWWHVEGMCYCCRRNFRKCFFFFQTAFLKLTFGILTFSELTNNKLDRNAYHYKTSTKRITISIVTATKYAIFEFFIHVSHVSHYIHDIYIDPPATKANFETGGSIKCYRVFLDEEFKAYLILSNLSSYLILYYLIFRLIYRDLTNYWDLVED